MTVAIDAFKKYAQQQIKQPEVNFQAKAIVAVGKRAQTVVDHPGWQTFLDHLGAIMDEKQGELDRTTKIALEGDALGEALEALKLRCVALKNELKGLKTAVDLIPEMIKRAEKIVEDRALPDQAAAD